MCDEQGVDGVPVAGMSAGQIDVDSEAAIVRADDILYEQNECNMYCHGCNWYLVVINRISRLIIIIYLFRKILYSMQGRSRYHVHVTHGRYQSGLGLGPLKV